MPEASVTVSPRRASWGDTVGCSQGSQDRVRYEAAESVRYRVERPQAHLEEADSSHQRAAAMGAPGDGPSGPDPTRAYAAQHDPLQSQDPWDSVRQGSCSLLWGADSVLAPLDDEPKTYIMEVILDSGATDHVASKHELPGYAVRPSFRSREGLHYAGASGHEIVNEGETDVVMGLPGEKGKKVKCDNTFQIAKVSKPLMSVPRICAAGLDVLYRKDEAVILDPEHFVVGRFPKKRGLYMADIEIDNPRHPGFHRQAK